MFDRGVVAARQQVQDRHVLGVRQEAVAQAFLDQTAVLRCESSSMGVRRPKAGEPTRRYTTTSTIRSCAHVTYLVWTGGTLRGLDPAQGALPQLRHVGLDAPVGAGRLRQQVGKLPLVELPAIVATCAGE